MLKANTVGPASYKTKDYAGKTDKSKGFTLGKKPKHYGGTLTAFMD